MEFYMNSFFNVSLLFLSALNLFLEGDIFAAEKSIKIESVMSGSFNEMREKIGPTVHAPTPYKEGYIFLATTGILYQSNKELTKLKKLLQTEQSSTGGLTLIGDKVYFGDGLHNNNNSFLYGYDLSKEELIFKVKVEGHIESAPLPYNNQLLITLGPKGIGYFSLETKDFIWKKSIFLDSKTKKRYTLHIDQTPILYGENICLGTIYSSKGIACLEAKSGKEISYTGLKYSQKSELGSHNHYLYGLATEADMVSTKWNTPATFFIFDMKKMSLIKEVSLRGYNFYRPLSIPNDEVFVTLSTGDLITISLEDGSIGYVSEFPEPFISNPFNYQGQFCAIGIMGKLLCYKKTKEGYGLSFEKRFMETPIGSLTAQNPSLIPSRFGFFKL